MTKQELIKYCFPIQDDDYIELPNGAELNYILKEILPTYLDEFAKQQSITFGVFMNKNYVQDGANINTYFNRETAEPVSLKDAYEIFIKSETP